MKLPRVRQTVAAVLILLIVGNMIWDWYVPQRRGVALILDRLLLPLLLLGYFGWIGREALLEKRRERWQREGRCLTCGYDLKETKERCPECGTSPVRLPA